MTNVAMRDFYIKYTVIHNINYYLCEAKVKLIAK